MSSNPFWEYSLKLYESPRAAAFCLDLQDAINNPGNGANINVLLFCCWAGSKGLTLTKDDFDELESTIGEWHSNTVLPLRAQRRIIGIPEQQKQNLLARELTAERTEQDMLFTWFKDRHKWSSEKQLPSNHPSTFLNIQRNISSYSERLSLPVNVDNPLQSAAQSIVLCSDDWCP